MELRQLATFRMVAETLSFTRAAAALGYVQSSVTTQIQALEEDLGVPLFDRLGKRVVLTDAGRRLLTYANKLVSLADEARAAVIETVELAGTLAISASETLCTYRLPGVLREFRLLYPHVRPLLRPGPWPELRRLVTEGALDVAFILEEPAMSPSSVSAELLVIEPVVVVAPPDHPLVAAPRVLPSDLANESLLLSEAGCTYRSLFERTLAASGVRPSMPLEFSSVEAIKQSVMAGLGIAALPEVVVAADVASGRLAALRWAGGDLRIATYMIWHKEKWLSPTLVAFMETARRLLTGAARAA